MATAYAIVRRDGHDGEPEVLDVMWREEDAIARVDKLNAQSTRPVPPYLLRTTWVARHDDAPPRLTPEDRELLGHAQRHLAIGTERPLSVFFSFTFNGEGAVRASNELAELGWPRAGCDEEVGGDGFWHTYGLGRRLRLDEEAILELREDMEALAERHGARFDGWDVTSGRGLRRASFGELEA